MKQVSAGRQWGWLPAILLCLPLSLAAQDEEDSLADALAEEEAYDAADFTPLPTWYFGALGGYVAPDSARDADYGVNAHAIIGLVLADAVALELNGFHTETNRDSDTRNDYSYGGGLDLTLGTPAPGNPLFMIGGGAIHEDLRTAGAAGTGYEDTVGYANAGLGLYLPFSFFGELWRIEGRYNVVFNDEAIPGEDILEDGRINIGVLLPLGREERRTVKAEAAPEPPPPPPPPPPPADSDQDGVADDRDQCPGTPRWVRPDANGCTPDSDGDGVDETLDCCPNTPAGSTVDGKGCVPPPPAPEPPADTDSDGDGVVDRLDQCPHTVPGYAVDASGCVKVQEVVLKSVHFELDSDALTGAAYRVLNSVADSLKAQPGTRFEIAGHADATGSPGYNMALSRRRAEVVRDFLIYTGVASNRLVAAGYGETRPIASNETEAGRAENRRVEFKPLGQ